MQLHPQSGRKRFCTEGFVTGCSRIASLSQRGSWLVWR